MRNRDTTNSDAIAMKLNLRFPSPQQVIVQFAEQETKTLEFVSPLQPEDYEDIRWYLEVYASSYTTDVDDESARRIEEKLPQWGKALFEAAFPSLTAQRLFENFKRKRKENREVGFITISAEHPAILSLPWELLHDPEKTYLLHSKPRMPIRRRLAGAGGGDLPFEVEPKQKLRILYIVSRPSDAGFIDPRGEAKPVLDAIDENAPGIVEVEFLRPATLDSLTKRLEDRRKPAVDMIHFDGHGTFDSDGRLWELAKNTDPAAATKGEGKKGNLGYLLFEDSEGKSALVSAITLADMLNEEEVGLMVLSACQSSQVAGEDAMGTIAARLTHAGIPSVIAMSYSVLVKTAQQFFAEFYTRLVAGEGTGEALDNARRNLYRNTGRGERQRGQDRITMKMQDWFLPTLYQSGVDTPLLQPGEVAEEEEETLNHNLPEVQEAGFWGRSEELWQIETAFVRGTKRITVTGFGGQGKTYLVQEAGRWLQRTGMFSHVCFVDYAAFQGIDAVGWAVSSLGVVLENSFVDVGAVGNYLRSHHKNRSLLLILDNLETLSPEALQELLTVAQQWSEIGENRLLITTRQGSLNHPGYPNSGSRKHIPLALSGLGREDALSYFQELMKLPSEPLFALPQRRELLKLFRLVDFHPLSIGLLANQLKVRRIGEVEGSLEKLIEETIAATANSEDKNVSLLASLRLSLQMLPEEVQGLLPKLGVFQGGVWEFMITGVMKLFTEEQWQQLRPALENAGLIKAEILPGWKSPYLKFHPTLTPILRQDGSSNIASLQESYCQAYYQLAGYLYDEDEKNPHQARAIAKRELPNLLNAVEETLILKANYVVQFVDSVSHFLRVLGLTFKILQLIEKVQQLVQGVNSRSWYLAQSYKVEELFYAGHYQEATLVCKSILANIGNIYNDELCALLYMLGSCLQAQGKVNLATVKYRQALDVASESEQSQTIQTMIGALHSELAEVMMQMGKLEDARKNYELSLTTYQKIGNERDEALVQANLGTLALKQGKLLEAHKFYQAALENFQKIEAPELEASSWNQLGNVHYEAKAWEAAEFAYRQSAQISESQGNLAGAAGTWHNLAQLCIGIGKLKDAEAWFRKSIKAGKEVGDMVRVSTRLFRLAFFLYKKTQNLSEACQLAEEALTISKTLDPAVAEIWNIYELLARIAQKQGKSSQAREYSRLAREAKWNFTGTRYELRNYSKLIGMVVATVSDSERRQQLEELLEPYVNKGWVNLVTAIRQILAGERDEDVFLEDLNYEDAVTIRAILQGIADPTTLQDLLAGNEE